MLFMAFGILIIALIVVLILLLSGAGMTEEEREAQLMESGHFIQGISVEGVDISGQTMDEALANSTLLSIAQQMEDGFSYTFTAGGHEYTLGAKELGITSSMNTTLTEAMKFGQLGDGALVREQKMQAQESGYDFKLSMYAQEAVVLEKLTAIKPTIDLLPQDATLEILDDMQEKSVSNISKRSQAWISTHRRLPS